MSDLIIKTNNLPSSSFKASAGMAQTSDFNQEDFGIPWLRIAQRTTKGITKGAPDYVPGLEAGMFFNSINGKVYGPSVKVSVIKFQRSYTEVQDDEGQTYVGPLTEAQYKNNLSNSGGDYKKARTPAGNKQKEQFNYFVILPEHLEDGMMRLGVGPGGFGACRAWNVQIASFMPGYAYAGVWEITLQYNDGEFPFFTIGVGSKPSAVRVGEVSGQIQLLAEAATLSIHDNLGRIMAEKVVGEDPPF